MDNNAVVATDFWYALRPEQFDIIRLVEVHLDAYSVGDIWLVRGSKVDLAVDTGSGIVPAGPIVEAISAKPVLAVALTCSYDHAGGWHSFTKRACHRLDAQELAHPTWDAADVAEYLPESSFSAYPRAGFCPADHRMIGARPTRLLDDGDTLELGDRSLEVIHTPGRSPGGLCLWEADEGILFSGEMLYDGSHGPAWPPENAESYSQSLRRLKDLPAQIVHAGHYGSFDGDRMQQLIAEQLHDLAGT